MLLDRAVYATSAVPSSTSCEDGLRNDESDVLRMLLVQTTIRKAPRCAMPATTDGAGGQAEGCSETQPFPIAWREDVWLHGGMTECGHITAWCMVV